MLANSLIKSVEFQKQLDRVPYPTIVDINSQYQCRLFFNTIQNGLHIIKHDLNFWHRFTAGTKHPQKICLLRDKINRYLRRWKGATFAVAHYENDDLWVPVNLPEHFCVDCGAYLKLHLTRCLSCACYFAYKIKPFYTDYAVKTLTIEFDLYKRGSGMEKAYRMVKMLESREKLEVTHSGCPTPRKCSHVRGSLLFKFSGGKLPRGEQKYKFSSVGNVTRIVRRSAW